MAVRLIPTPQSSVSPEMEDLYLNSFPPEERRPWQQLLRLIDTDPRFSFLTVTSGDTVAGFITLWNLGEVMYVEHFAILPSLRGGGIGSQAVRTLINTTSIPVILEVEPASSGEMARRRINFYSRSGLIPHHDFHYLQPPYSPGLPSVPLTLMTSSPDVDLTSASKIIHRVVYGL